MELSPASHWIHCCTRSFIIFAYCVEMSAALLLLWFCCFFWPCFSWEPFCCTCHGLFCFATDQNQVYSSIEEASVFWEVINIFGSLLRFIYSFEINSSVADSEFMVGVNFLSQSSIAS